MIEGFTSAFDCRDRSLCSVRLEISLICAKFSFSSVNYCHLLQVLFCRIRSENVIDGIEVGVLVICELKNPDWVLTEIIHSDVNSSF